MSIIFLMQQHLEVKLCTRDILKMSHSQMQTLPQSRNTKAQENKVKTKKVFFFSKKFNSRLQQIVELRRRKRPERMRFQLAKHLHHMRKIPHSTMVHRYEHLAH